MDRPIPPGRIRRRRLHAGLRAVAALVAVTAGLLVAGSAMRPTLRRAELRTARVVQGPIAATLEATGSVVPRRESVLASASDTHVVEVVAKLGASVTPGEPLVILDGSRDRLEVERLDRQLLLKANEREQARLILERSLADLVADEAGAKLSLASHERRAARDGALRDQGIVVDDVVRESEDLVARDRIELVRLATRRDEARRELDVKLAALDLEHAILEKERLQAEALLEQATVRADTAGVVTWLASTPGASVRRGDEVARIADLSAFDVEATLSDVHASRVRAGQEAVVEANGARLDGVVDQVRPAVDGGSLRLRVLLREPSHPSLRQNLRVDVDLVTARKADALVLPSAPFAQPDGSNAAWVVRGSRAVKTPVVLGIAGQDLVEVASGLSVGDEVLLRDMSELSNLQEVRIR